MNVVQKVAGGTRFAVVFLKRSGREVEYQRYDDAKVARDVAELLRDVGEVTAHVVSIEAGIGEGGALHVQ